MSITTLLSETDERTIAACNIAFGDSQADLARRYDVSTATISKIVAAYKAESKERARISDAFGKPQTWQEAFDAWRKLW